jgi:hypothetical protein
MARERDVLLDSGDSFPDLAFNLVDDGKMSFLRDTGGRWRVLLIYRGHW